jgi:hypothetical protein
MLNSTQPAFGIGQVAEAGIESSDPSIQFNYYPKQAASFYFIITLSFAFVFISQARGSPIGQGSAAGSLSDPPHRRPLSHRQHPIARPL